MKFKCNLYGATVYQLLIPLLFLWLTRFAFYAYNADVVGELSAAQLLSVGFRGLVFDVVAVAYVNSLFILMRFLPFDFVMSRWWQRLTMTVYFITNAMMLMVNIGDIVYFRFNNGRMQADSFLQMLDSAMLATAFSYIAQYWWAFAAVAAVIALFIRFATLPQITGMASGPWRRVGLLLAALSITFVAMRGGRVFSHPVGIDTASAIARQPAEINVLLNTPVCIIRSSGSTGAMPDRIFFSPERLAALRSSLHNGAIGGEPDTLQTRLKGKNIVLIILESGAQIWLDSISVVDNRPYNGLMPYLDSLAGKSMALT